MLDSFGSRGWWWIIVENEGNGREWWITGDMVDGRELIWIIVDDKAMVDGRDGVEK